LTETFFFATIKERGEDMTAYAIILFLCAALFGVLALLIYRGNTNLIHDYHQTKVTDKNAYGKAFGKAMAVMAVALALSASVSLLGEKAMWGALAVLLVGLAIGIAAIVRVQKKYNGGVF